MTIHDSLFAIDITKLYPDVKGEDFVNQKGDLSVYFAHIPSSAIDTFMSKWADIRASYRTIPPVAGQVTYVDYALSDDVVLSFPKTGKQEAPKRCYIWIGKRKQEVDIASLIKVFTDLKAF
jgi:hypothetical protein